MKCHRQSSRPRRRPRRLELSDTLVPDDDWRSRRTAEKLGAEAPPLAAHSRSGARHRGQPTHGAWCCYFATNSHVPFRNPHPTVLVALPVPAL